MIKPDYPYKITITNGFDVVYEVSADRLCQAIKKFIGYAVNNNLIKKTTLIGYFIRNRIITRYELGVMFFDPDIGRSDDAKRVKEK